MQITFSSVFGVALLCACTSIEAQPPTCTQPVGKWQDQLQSVLEIKTYDPSTGAIAGQYISHSGAGSWPMVGWINPAADAASESCKGCKSDHAEVITFTVRWTKHSSVTAWTGTCAVNSRSGHEQIWASWHTSRPNSGFEWDHTLTGAEPFIPISAAVQNTQRIPLPPSQNPRNADLPIAGAVWAGDTLYVSGWLDPDLKTHADTKSQTEGLIKDIQKLLGSENLTLADVVMMRVYLGADPAKGGKGDFEGMMAAYSQFFGTPEQPNKPARTTVQVVLPAGERGALVEIDVIAVRPK